MQRQTRSGDKVTVARLLRNFSILLLATTLWSCASGIYGNFEPNGELTDAFYNYEVLPEYNYYYTGPEASPIAILGVRKEYTLISELWQPFSPTHEQLGNIIARMNDYYDFPDFGPYGAYIISPTGERVAIWYSRIDYTTVRIEDHRIEIYTPDLFQYHNNSMKFLQLSDAP